MTRLLLLLIPLLGLGLGCNPESGTPDTEPRNGTIALAGSVWGPATLAKTLSSCPEQGGGPEIQVEYTALGAGWVMRLAAPAASQDMIECYRQRFVDLNFWDFANWPSTSSGASSSSGAESSSGGP